MNLDRLNIFLKVVEAGSVSMAARLVHLSQPAVSRNLRLLEEELSVALFTRHGRGLALTPAGRALVPRAESRLQTTIRVARDLARFSARGYYDLRLGMLDSVVGFLLPKVISPLEEAFPSLSLKLETGHSRALLEAVTNATMDVVVVASDKSARLDRALRIGPHNVQYYGRGRRFPALAKVIRVEQLAGFPMIELATERGRPSMIRADATNYAKAGSLASVKALVLAGMGVGSLPGFVFDDRERVGLVWSSLPSGPKNSLYCVWARSWTGDTAESIVKALVSGLAGALT